MKFEKLESITSPTMLRYSTFLFVEGIHGKGDVIFIGCECGQLIHCAFSTRGVSRQEYLSKDGFHTSRITCLMYSSNKSLSPTSEGLLFSASRDRTIKIWNFHVTTGKTLVQTCYGHTAGVTSIVDGKDGTYSNVLL